MIYMRSMANPEGKRATGDLVSYRHDGTESQSYMGTVQSILGDEVGGFFFPELEEEKNGDEKNLIKDMNT